MAGLSQAAASGQHVGRRIPTQTPSGAMAQHTIISGGVGVGSGGITAIPMEAGAAHGDPHVDRRGEIGPAEVPRTMDCWRVLRGARHYGHGGSLNIHSLPGQCTLIRAGCPTHRLLRNPGQSERSMRPPYPRRSRGPYIRWVGLQSESPPRGRQQTLERVTTSYTRMQVVSPGAVGLSQVERGSGQPHIDHLKQRVRSSLAVPGGGRAWTVCVGVLLGPGSVVASI